MKPSELRIGNYVQAGTADEVIIGKIQSLGDTAYLEFTECESMNNGLSILSHEACFNDGYLNAIPLTEKWLLRFGFDQYVISYYRKGEFYITYANTGLHEYKFRDYPVLISTVHQLQNLYFILSGEELTIKETSNSLK